jgi:hypothetical protein
MDYKISIITSILNGKKFIKGFLEDVERQTIFKDCQLIMIDANSDDYLETEKHIHAFTQKHDNASYYKIIIDDDYQVRNIPGVYKVWNMAIQDYAESEMLTNWNIDDRRDPRNLELHYNALYTDPSVDLAYAPVLETNAPNETMEKNSANLFHDLPDYTLDMLFTVNMPHNGPVWRAHMHDEYGYFDESYFSAGDYDMWLRAALEGSLFFKVCKEPLGLYYRNPEGISSKQSTLGKALQEVADVKTKHLKTYLEKRGSLSGPQNYMDFSL